MKICYQCFKEYDSEYHICPHCGQSEDLSVGEPQYLKPGTVLQNRYLLGVVVGAGGFGTTYAAWDRVLNQKVAVKEYLPGEFSTRMPGQTTVTVYGGEKTEQFRDGKNKFCEESRKLARFQEIPGIVHIYNSFEENGTAYIVMEFLEGETLAERLKREKKISEQEAIRIVLPVLQALDTVHQEGILHRDIAPNNIFLTKSGEVKLLDFGAARSVTGTHSKSLTVLYKEGYTPEEQYRSRGDQRTWTDVYACAATLYHMLTGHVPPGALERRRKDTLKEPSRAGAKVSAQVDKAVMNALNVDIRYRTQTAGQFMKELTGEVKAKEHFVRTAERKVGRIPLPLIGLGTIAAAGVAIFLILLVTGIIHIDVQSFSQLNVPEGMVRVPNLVNCDLETTQSKTEDVGLCFMIVDKQFSTEIPENRVLTQNVQPGSIVNSESQINLVMSGGINTMTESELKEKGIALKQMPDVQYQDRDEAMSLLIDMGLDVKVEYERTGIVEGKKIIRQSIGAGEPLVGDEQSAGPEVVITVEDFVVDWTDAEPFEKKVRESLNKGEGDIWASEMLDIEEIEISDFEGGGEYRIASLASCLNMKVLILETNDSLRHIIHSEDDNVSILDVDDIKNIVNMEVLYLCGINMGNIDWINRIKGLKFLVISGSVVNDISSLEGLEQLELLSISETSFKQIHGIKLPQSIEKLEVNGSTLETMLFVENMNNVNLLGVYGCTEANIDQIAELSGLETLEVWGYMEPMPSLGSLYDMTSLKKVKVICPLDEHECSMMMKEIARLTQIKELRISGGLENGIPFYKLNLSYFENMTNLECLDLWGMNLFEVNRLCNMGSLKELEIDDCGNIELQDLIEATQLEKVVIDGVDRSDELKRLQS